MEFAILSRLNDLLKSKRVKEPEYEIGTIIKEPERVTKKTRGGIQDSLTAERIQTLNFLNSYIKEERDKISLGQILGLTKLWDTDQLYQLRRKAESFTKNPPALWWKLYKQINNDKKRNYKDIPRVWKERRKQDETTQGQRTLF